MYKELGRRVAKNPGIARPTRDQHDDPVHKLSSKGVVIVFRMIGKDLKVDTRSYYSLSRELVMEAAKQAMAKQAPGYILVFYYDMLEGKQKLFENGDRGLYKKWMKRKKSKRR